VHSLLQNELRAKCVGVLRVPAVLEYTYVYIMHIICPPRGFSWGLGAQRISRQICPDAPAQANNFPDNSAERGFGGTRYCTTLRPNARQFTLCGRTHTHGVGRGATGSCNKYRFPSDIKVKGLQTTTAFVMSMCCRRETSLRHHPRVHFHHVSEIS
jgi:hypothetical protein